MPDQWRPFIGERARLWTRYWARLQYQVFRHARVLRRLDHLNFGVSRHPMKFGPGRENTANVNLGEKIVTLLEVCPSYNHCPQQI
jgi:hypothetical protein